MPRKSYRSRVMCYMTTEERQDLEVREKSLGRGLTPEEFRKIYPVTTKGRKLKKEKEK